MMVERRPVAWHWQRMPAVTLTQDPPVQNTWYTVLNTIRNVNIRSLALKQINDEAAVKVVAWRVTLDGVANTYAVNYNNNEKRFMFLRETSDTTYWTTITVPWAFGNFVTVFAKSAKVEIRITDAPGTNPKLYAWVGYDQLKRVIK